MVCNTSRQPYCNCDDTIAALDAEIEWLAGLAAKRDAERGVDRCARCMEFLCDCSDFDWKAGQRGPASAAAGGVSTPRSASITAAHSETASDFPFFHDNSDSPKGQHDHAA